MKIIGSTSAFRNDLDHALSRLKAMGFDAVDLIVIESWGLVSFEKLLSDFSGETERVESLLEKHGLKAMSLNSAFTPQLFDRSDEVQNALRRRQVEALCRFMKQLGIRIGTHYPGYIADWMNDPEGVWSGTVESLREIQEIAGDYEVTLAPEIHYKTPFEAPDDVRRLLGEIPGLPYTYEPSHFIINGLDVETTADLLEGACHYHLRTAAPGRIQAAPPDGLDALDWMMDRLHAADYQGLVSIEYLPDADFDTEAAIIEIKNRFDR